MSSLLLFCLLLYHIDIAITSPTPYPTPYKPPNEYCTAPQYFDSNDYTINTQTTSFLDEDDNSFWIKLYEPNTNILQRQLFNINTNYNFNPKYNHIVFTSNISGNFNNNSNYYITNINPKFFISDSNNYIGVSFNNGKVSFTGTSCNGTTPLLTTPIPTDTTSISYINPTNINTSLGGTHIQISLHMNRTYPNTFVVVKWTDYTQTIQYQSICEYNSVFNDTSNIIFTTASAMNDDYYRFDSIDFHFCSISMNITNAMPTAVPTPAPTDYIYNNCPNYKAELSDYIQLENYTTNSQIASFYAASSGVYTYNFRDNPIKHSEWLLKSKTYIEMDSLHSSSLRVTVNIGTVIGCTNEVITVKDNNTFVSVYFNENSIGFYPACDTSMSEISMEIYDQFPDPISNMTFDYNNIIWDEGLNVKIDPQITFIFDVIADTTTAYITTELNSTKANVDFKCKWDGIFTDNSTINVLLASTTNKSCRIKDIKTEYCSVQWKYGLDFCEDLTQTIELNLWSDTKKDTIGTELVHGSFRQNTQNVNVNYNNIPPHELIDITTTFYIQRSVLSQGDVIEFLITLVENNNNIAKTVAVYNQSVSDNNICVSPWSAIDSYCEYDINKYNFNHTNNNLHVIVSYNATSGGIPVFKWAFNALCIDQSFKITNAPTTTPTHMPTLPTASPSNAPTQPPTRVPSNAPTSPPSNTPTQPPSIAPSTAPTSPPSNTPTQPPSIAPSNAPTSPPSIAPSISPSIAPSIAPTQPPSIAPSIVPTQPPSIAPTQPPSLAPSIAPTQPPSISPTQPPSIAPSIAPTQPPSNAPTQPPSIAPSIAPTSPPSLAPSIFPSISPSIAPTQPPSLAPSVAPSIAPSNTPTSPPSVAPSIAPSISPTLSPSIAPSLAPSIAPTQPPSLAPSIAPSFAPSNAPSIAPSQSPSISPTQPPSNTPSLAPTQPPSIAPSISPTSPPSLAPSAAPSIAPTQPPSLAPSLTPSITPSISPTQPPSLAPSISPTSPPSIAPSISPSIAPSISPTQPPSFAPSISPTQPPSTNPSLNPSIAPSIAPSFAPTMPPTGSPTSPGQEKSQLKLQNSKGKCNFTCWQCLQQIDVVGGGNVWDFVFRDNKSQCACPNEKGIATNDSTTVQIGKENAKYYLEIEKYTITDDDVKHGIRVNVIQWGNEPQNCNVSYIVNENEFFGVQSNNILVIKFKICDQDASQLTPEAIINQTLGFKKYFANLFKINEFWRVNASIEVGDFCADEPEQRQRRRLRNTGNDEEVTVVIVFAEANHATAAQGNACDEVVEEYGIEPGNCETAVQTEDEFYSTERSSNEIGIDLVAGIVIAILLSCVLFALGFFCYYSIKKTKEKKKLEDKWVRKRGNTGDRHGAISAAPMHHKHLSSRTVTSASDDNISEGIEMVTTMSTNGTLSTIGETNETAVKKALKKKKRLVPNVSVQLIDIRPSDVIVDGIKLGKINRSTRSSQVPNWAANISNSIQNSIDIAKCDPEIPNSPGAYYTANTSSTPGSNTHTHTTTLDEQIIRVISETTGSQYDNFHVDQYGHAVFTHPGTPNISGGAYEFIDEEEEEIVNLNNKKYKSEKEMIDDVIKNNKANLIEMNDIQIDKQIGSGQFGAVFKAEWEGNIVVIKQLNSLDDNGNNENDSDLKEEDVEKQKLIKQRTQRKKEMEAEIILASSLPRHNNLVEIFGYIKLPFGVVMSYMAGDSVEKYVYRKYKNKNNKICDIFELLIILKKAASGLKHLHKYGLIHRDIACRNILLGKINSNKINELTEVRISDFGLTRQLEEDDIHNDNIEQKTQSNFGPLKWMAPESIKQKLYSKKSDVYMFGITMWEIFYGCEPYINMTPINVAMGVVNQNLRPIIYNNENYKYQCLNMNDAYASLMKDCWNKKPQKRPPFKYIINNLSYIQSNPLSRAP